MGSDANDTRPRVLYVDLTGRRSERVRRELRGDGERSGLRVTTASSADEFADALDETVDCVVVAVDAVGADALSLLSSVATAYPTVKTVLLTERDPETVRERVGEAGVDEVVHYTGPESARALAECVERQVEGSAAGPSPQAQLDALVDSINDAIITIDADNRVRYANAAVESMFGYRPDELVGEPVTKIATPAAGRRHTAGHRRYVDTGERTVDWTDVETTARHRDGREIPVSISFSEFAVDGERYFTGIVRDISDRKRREQQLERYEAVMQTVGDGLYALDEEGKFIAVNDAYTELVGRDRSALLGRRAAEFIPEQATEEAERLQAEMEAGNSGVETLESTLTTADGEDVPVEARLSLFPLGDGRFGRVGAVRDISDRRRREERLALLHEVAQSLTAAETPAEVAELVVEAASAMLDLPLTTVELYDEEAGRLVPAAQTAAARELVGESPLLGPDSDVPWRAYANNEPQVYDDLQEAAGFPSGATPLASAMVLPIGRYGVFVSGSTAAGAFADAERTVADILVADARAALDRVDREQELRSQRDRLAEQNDALERLDRINGVIRSITRSLTRATSRGEIERAVCEELVGAGSYTFCWVGKRTSVAGGEVTPSASAGDGAGYLDTISVSTAADDAEGSGPMGRAYRTREVQVQNDLHADPPFEPWRTAAIERGFRSCIAVPLRYKKSIYGVLVIYADEAEAFDRMEVAVLAELGEMVGYAINALEQKRTLGSGAVVELEFGVDDPDVPAIRFAREIGGSFEFDEFVQRSDGTFRVFFTVRGAEADAVREFADPVASVRDVSLLGEGDDGARFEATVTHSGFLGTLASYGAALEAMSATPDGGRVTVMLPRDNDVQTFIETFLDSFEGAELMARRERDRPVQTRDEFQTVYKDRLTKRQEEVLKTAYFSGFFEWPRQKTGQEVASMLGVSQPTVSRHIRGAERKLLDVVFGDDEPPEG